MSIGGFVEPLIIVVIAITAVYINRRQDDDEKSDGSWSPSSNGSIYTESVFDDSQWRHRQLFGKWSIKSRSTTRWKKTLGSLYLKKFPFLIEFCYQFCVYWAYQLGRAFSALTLKMSTLEVARLHALAVISVEKSLGIFFEHDVQQFFLDRPFALAMINRIYSFIHIPGTMAFLAWLYWYAPAELYQARRRTLAICNLMAFVVFTSWPCMPPRLLPQSDGFDFVDTVHSGGSSSVWTTNRFCNQLAAMPSLHFGYSFVIGLTIATIPIEAAKIHIFGWMPRRFVFVSVGMFYPALMLVAIIATANHFVLDAVAGFCISIIGWNANKLLLNLLPLEDLVLYTFRLHKPSRKGETVRQYNNEWLKEKADVEAIRGWLKSP